MHPDLHIPTPGRVQYYRAEALPFVPNEIKTQLRFPKAYAKSQMNLRYLDQVKKQTQDFLDQTFPQNYFTGEDKVTLSITMDEAYSMFNASEAVKEMASSGAMNQLHQRVKNAHEAATSHYESVFGSLHSVINTAQSKEDEVIDQIHEAFPGLYLRKNDSTSQNVFSMLRSSSLTSVNNLAALHNHSSQVAEDDHHLFNEYQAKLNSLLMVQGEALEQLIILQDSWNSTVEND